MNGENEETAFIKGRRMSIGMGEGTHTITTLLFVACQLTSYRKDR